MTPSVAEAITGVAAADIERTARFLGLPLEFPQVMPFPSIAAARAVYWVQDQDPEQARALARAMPSGRFSCG